MDVIVSQLTFKYSQALEHGRVMAMMTFRLRRYKILVIVNQSGVNYIMTFKYCKSHFKMT